MSIEQFNKFPHYICDYVSKYAQERPDDIAIIDADTGKYVSWKEFDNAIDIIALRLIEMGFQKGDIIVSMLPLLLEHIFFEFACFKLGIMWCPLDVRLKEMETVRCVKLLEPDVKMYLHPDDTDSEDKWGRKKRYDFKQIAHAVKENCPSIENFIQFSLQEDAEKGTIGFMNFLKKAKENWYIYSQNPQLFKKKREIIRDYARNVKEDDPILIIYTTGTTGFPKPAMLTNVGIVCQNFCMAKGFKISSDDRMLVNLPPSHVGCQTEQLMTTIFAGGISVVLHAFKADKTLKAIEQYKVTTFGQIPSLFVMEWRLPDYDTYDLSSLRFALYGGQGVSRRFLDNLSTMAPHIGSGLGLTEMSGFVSYTPFGGPPEDILASLGYDFPITPLTIREPMKEDRRAGDELPDGEIGEICYSGPQVFKGYYGKEQATQETISKEGICYTGDLGYKNEKGLHLAGRAKFVIKPKGYQVYPPEVENHIEEIPKVSSAAVVGAKHEVYSEGVVAFVELRKNKNLSKEEINQHCKKLAGYKRPSLIIFLEQIPLNRVDKTDYKILNEKVSDYVEKARAEGKWDAKEH
ncbi:MAG: class I adenylate-forming enzyme family protein [Promethearchaeia archaeon]